MNREILHLGLSSFVKQSRSHPLAFGHSETTRTLGAAPLFQGGIYFASQ